MLEALVVLLGLLLGAHVLGNVVTFAARQVVSGRPLFPEVPSPDETPWRERLASIGREVGAASVFRLLAPLGLWPERLPEPGEWRGRRPPVILVHGYQMNRASMFFLQLWLKKKGFLAVSLNHGALDSVEAKAARLAGRVEWVLRRTGAPKVSLVCHSLGGLVGRYYVERLGGAQRVAHLVTLGTPHRGTPMAVFARGPLATQMLPGSALLQSFATGPLALTTPADPAAPPAAPMSLDAAPEVKYTAITGTEDTVVFPLEAGQLGPPHVDKVLFGLGHNTLLAHSAAFCAVRDALVSDTLRPSTGLHPTDVALAAPVVTAAPSAGGERHGAQERP